MGVRSAPRGTPRFHETLGGNHVSRSDRLQHSLRRPTWEVALAETAILPRTWA